LDVVETTAQSSGAIVVERVLTAGHKPSTPSEQPRRAEIRSEAKDNIQEVRFWQEKKLSGKTIHH
jgi:hypothetical protein